MKKISTKVVTVCTGLGGTLLTVAAFFISRQITGNLFENNLKADVSVRKKIIQGALEETKLIAISSARFIEASEEIDKPRFRTFVKDFVEGDHGLTAMALVGVVPKAERDAFERGESEQTGEKFFIFERKPGAEQVPAGDRETYFPIMYTVARRPPERKVLGYDLGSTEERAATLALVAESAEPIVAERLILAGTGGEQELFILAPFYRAGADGKKKLGGFVQAIFSFDDLMRLVLRDTEPIGLPFDVIDMSAPPEKRLVYHWTARMKSERGWDAEFFPSGFHVVDPVPFAGRDWVLDVRPSIGYYHKHYPLDFWLILPVGLLLTIVLAGYFRAGMAKREQLKEINAQLRDEISLRGEVEENLRVSETKYKIVADNTYDWEFWVAPDGRYLYSSPSCERVTGYAPADFAARPLLEQEILYPEDRAKYKDHRHDVTWRPSVRSLEFRITARDGAVRWIDHVCQPVFGDDGTFLGTRGNNRDITERKRIEEERENLILELQRARDDIRTLEGILPICSSCKRIRDDTGHWTQVEKYVRERTRAEFSHGICPECAEKLYPDLPR